MADIKFEIVKKLGVLSEGSRGWQKEINLVSWNGRDPKIDLRDWDENHERMGKGVTLGKDETYELKRILEDIDIEKLKMQ